MTHKTRIAHTQETHLGIARRLFKDLLEAESVDEDLGLIAKHLGLADQGYAALGDGRQSEAMMENQVMERAVSAHEKKANHYLASAFDAEQEAKAQSRPMDRAQRAALLEKASWHGKRAAALMESRNDLTHDKCIVKGAQTRKLAAEKSFPEERSR